MHIQRNISTINDCFLKTKQTFTICSKQNFIKLQNVRDPYEYIYIYIYIYISISPQIRVLSFPGLISVARVNK